MIIKDNVKVIVGVEDSLQDAQIDRLIANAEARLKVWLKQHAGLTAIPEELIFIVEELTVSRYNRIGSEGMKSESVEGRSISFTDDDFMPYMSILETYIPSSKQPGKVIFF
ncbi:phage head-tail connector protein [Rossellomorea vietnamensis]|uniref:Phage head-tail connector protein n=1 Tax=Rossellomorea vietnamensis TaxID=218284 RepID=A0A5D4MCA3_9BACI|nr:phage head-tail connector protein [Rossellomorea vietnamensis]TYR99077.1 phage head-tail connector protein [Rossellomorea vietnamensis]